MGQHADRNAQFEKIAQLKQQYFEAGRPVISIDTKKKEMLGNFYRDGVTDGVESTAAAATVRRTTCSKKTCRHSQTGWS